MQLSFANKSVVVTGANRGIGLAIALGFARAGARVAICARGKEGLDAAAAEIARYAAKVHGISVTKPLLSALSPMRLPRSGALMCSSTTRPA